MLFRLKIRGMRGYWLACCEEVDGRGIDVTPKQALDLLAMLSTQVQQLIQAERDEQNVLAVVHNR